MSTAIITAALTGPIATKADNPALPTSPEEIADAAVGAWEAGAAIVHVHLRDAAGAPTADLEIARRTVGLIEERCPVLVQLSTGVGLDVAFEEREELVLARPRMATLNVCSMSFGAGEFRNPPDGVPASSNVELVARLVHIARAIERDPADPAQAEELLSLPGAG